MNVTLQYFDSCPNWKVTDDRLKDVIDRYHLDVDLTYQLVGSPEEAEKYAFHGSPSILVDGEDPFSTEDTRVGYACRIYVTATGETVEAPSVEQIAQALGV
jgi:hypothetical protein